MWYLSTCSSGPLSSQPTDETGYGKGTPEWQRDLPISYWKK
jgi:hypothetical protein